MKRILVIENAVGFGGALTSLESYLSAVPCNDWEFHVLVSYRQNYIKENGVVKAVRVIKRNRIYGAQSSLEKRLAPILGSRAGNVSFVMDYLTTGRKYARRIKDYILRNDIDLVHLNNGTLINDSAILGAKKSKVPILVHVRAPDYISLPTSLLAKKVDHFLPISKYVQDSLFSMGVPAHKQTVVPEGLDAEAFAEGADGCRFKRT